MSESVSNSVLSTDFIGDPPKDPEWVQKDKDNLIKFLISQIFLNIYISTFL